MAKIETPTEEKIKIMQAYVDGKDIECRLIDRVDHEWVHVTTSYPLWNWPCREYRIKATPREFYVNESSRSGLLWCSIYMTQALAFSSRNSDWVRTVKFVEVLD